MTEVARIRRPENLYFTAAEDFPTTLPPNLLRRRLTFYLLNGYTPVLSDSAVMDNRSFEWLAGLQADEEPGGPVARDAGEMLESGLVRVALRDSFPQIRDLHDSRKRQSPAPPNLPDDGWADQLDSYLDSIKFLVWDISKVGLRFAQNLRDQFDLTTIQGSPAISESSAKVINRYLEFIDRSEQLALYAEIVALINDSEDWPGYIAVSAEERHALDSDRDAIFWRVSRAHRYNVAEELGTEIQDRSISTRLQLGSRTISVQDQADREFQFGVIRMSDITELGRIDTFAFNGEELTKLPSPAILDIRRTSAFENLCGVINAWRLRVRAGAISASKLDTFARELAGCYEKLAQEIELAIVDYNYPTQAALMRKEDKARRKRTTRGVAISLITVGGIEALEFGFPGLWPSSLSHALAMITIANQARHWLMTRDQGTRMRDMVFRQRYMD